MRMSPIPLLGALAFTTLVTSAGAFPFLPVRPGHLPPPPKAEARHAGYGIVDNCYLVEAPGAPAGAKPTLVQECD